MDGLPPGWSAKFDERMNRWYYINHAAKTTQWEKPQVQTQPVVGLTNPWPDQPMIHVGNQNMDHNTMIIANNPWPDQPVVHMNNQNMFQQQFKPHNVHLPDGIIRRDNMQSEHRVQFNPTQKSTAELREEKVDEIMNEFLPDSRYDDEMRTLVRELLVSYDDDKTSVVDQIKSLGIGQQTDYDETSESDDEFNVQQRIAAEQAAREELEAEQSRREAALAAQRKAEEEQERKEELERKKRREEYKRKEKEKREKEVREKRQREIERQNKEREKERVAELRRKKQNEERMKREQPITNQATKPQEQKKTKAPIKVNFDEMNMDYVDYENGGEHYEDEDYGVYYEDPYEHPIHENQVYRGSSVSSSGSPEMPYQIGIDTSGLAGSMGSLGLNRGSAQYGSMSGRLATMGRQKISQQFKDLTLDRIIYLLESPDASIASNAAAYLQHLTFNNTQNKREIRLAGGIEALVTVLEDRRSPDQLVEHAAGALRNASFGCNENKIQIKNCEGISALLKTLRRRSTPYIRVHTTGALWNLSSHQAIKQSLLDQVLNDCVERVLMPYADLLKRHHSTKDIPGFDQVFINVAGIVRNLSSHSDAARRRMRETDGLLDALCDIIKLTTQNADDNDINERGIEGAVCALRNLTYKIHRESSNTSQVRPKLTETTTKLMGLKTVVSAAKYEEPHIPQPDPNSRGIDRLLEIAILLPLVTLMHNSTNPQTIEASIGIVQNLTADHYVTSAYLRAQFRKEKGLPILVERITDQSPTISHTSIIALRNLAVDLKNRDLVGKYGMKEVCMHIPDAKQSVQFEEKPAVNSLYLAKTLVEYMPENGRKFIEHSGLLKTIEINQSNYHSDRLKKAAGQVLQAMWNIEELRPFYKKELKLKRINFQPTISHSGETLRRDGDSYV